MRARFRLIAIIQVAFLVASVTLLSWSLLHTPHIAVPTLLATVILLQVLGLVRYVEHHVDTLEDFFAAINYEDFTQHFIEDDVDTELKNAFNRIVDRFQDARAERDVQANYLEVVVRHVPVPLIAARSDGSLRLVNNPARRLIGVGTEYPAGAAAAAAGSDPGRTSRAPCFRVRNQDKRRSGTALLHRKPVRRTNRT